MNREQMIAWLTLEGYQGCTGAQLDWIYQWGGPWAFKWGNRYAGESFKAKDNYPGKGVKPERGYSHEEMLVEYGAQDGWPSDAVLVELMAMLEGAICD